MLKPILNVSLVYRYECAIGRQPLSIAVKLPATVKFGARSGTTHFHVVDALANKGLLGLGAMSSFGLKIQPAADTVDSVVPDELNYEFPSIIRY